MKPTIDLTGLDISAALDVAARDFDRTMARTLKRDVEEWRASGANADAIAAMTEMCRARWQTTRAAHLAEVRDWLASAESDKGRCRLQ